MGAGGGLRERVARKVADERKQAIVYAVLVVLLTPVGLLVAAVVAFVALSYGAHGLFRDLSYGASLLAGMNLVVALMVIRVALTNRTRGVGPSKRFLGGVAVYFVMVFGCYGTALPDDIPAVFGVGYTLLGVAALALLGHAYAPRGTYDLLDDPFTMRWSEREAQRQDFAFGLATVLPHSILEAYGELFASSWLWRRPDERDVAIAAELLGSVRQGAKKPTARAEPSRMAAVVELLCRLDLVRRTPSGLEITLAGKDFVDAA